MEQPPLPEFDPEITLPWWKRRPARVLLGLCLLGGALLGWTTQPLLWRPRRVASLPVDPTCLEEDVRALVEAFPRRDERHPKTLEAAALWIEGRMKAVGGRMTRQSYEVHGALFINVVARFGPEQGERVIVGAHYDACDGLPGADDNASAIAGLLALARMYQEHPPKHPVELVAYTLEEPPHFRFPTMGSVVHARSLAKEGAKVRAMICLETIGTFEDRPGSQTYPIPGLGWVYPDRGNFIAVVGDVTSPLLVRRVKGAMASASPLPVWSINAPAAIPGIDFSDHRSYWAEGFPAVMVTDSAFYRNPRYHTARDTPDRLDYPRMAQVIQGVQVAVDRLMEE